MPSCSRPPEPWDSFLRELDAAVNSEVRLDCIGGFVITQFYGLNRPTGDVDVIEIAPRDAAQAVVTLGALGEPLSRKHHVYLDRVGVASAPETMGTGWLRCFRVRTSFFG
jgi:hypothetical protein